MEQRYNITNFPTFPHNIIGTMTLTTDKELKSSLSISYFGLKPFLEIKLKNRAKLYFVILIDF